MQLLHIPNVSRKLEIKGCRGEKEGEGRKKRRRGKVKKIWSVGFLWVSPYNPALKANLAAELTLKMESFLFRVMIVIGAARCSAAKDFFLEERGREML